MYKHDVLDGDSEKWYENGHRESIYPYKNGMLNGDAKHWNEQGKLTYTTEYKDDKSREPIAAGANVPVNLLKRLCLLMMKETA